MTDAKTNEAWAAIDARTAPAFQVLATLIGRGRHRSGLPGTGQWDIVRTDWDDLPALVDWTEADARKAAKLTVPDEADDLASFVAAVSEFSKARDAMLDGWEGRFPVEVTPEDFAEDPLYAALNTALCNLEGAAGQIGPLQPHAREA